MDIILFGPPGAGKGTQAAVICKTVGVPHVSTGDIFRRHLKEGTALGELARGFMDRGQLVPDDVVVKIVAHRLEEPDAACGALFDGFPRTVKQAELLAEWLEAHARRVDLVIDLAVDEEVVVGRLSGRRACMSCGATYHVTNNPPKRSGVCDRCEGEVVQRKDDAVETVRARIQTYHRDTAPVLAWLEARYPVHRVQADRPIADVEAQVHSALTA